MNDGSPDPEVLEGVACLTITEEMMAQTTLFRKVDLSLIIDRLQKCSKREIRKGEILIDEGQINEILYIILSGRLQIRLKSHEQLDISVVMAGDCVGEMSVIDGRPATATVSAEEDTTLLEIPRDLIWTLIDKTTFVSRNLLYILSGRLRMGNLVITAGHEEKSRYQKFATQDKLTGLQNRRWFDEALEKSVSSAMGTGENLSLVIFDIDHFKRFNDTYGHPAGDHVLRRVAEAVRSAVRRSDTPARYGGEEFAVILAGASKDVGKRVGETLRSSVEGLGECPFEGSTLPRVTVSLGVATLSTGETPKDLVRRADEALYRAKDRGRNRVETD